MAPLSVVSFVACLGCVSSAPEGSKLYDPKTHKAVGSSGCGKVTPYTKGESVTAFGTYGGFQYRWRIYVPKVYDSNTPMPLVLQHPGWGMNAKTEEAGAGITLFAESRGFISVTPQGANDNNATNGGPWFSWNAVGTTQSPGPGGPTCTSDASAPRNCYNSCQPCTDNPQCSWTTCENEVTPTGTGTSDVTGFIPMLYNTLEEQLCIDTTREYAAGESNGGMMTYQLGVNLGTRLAAIAPQFGSFMRGFNMIPAVGVPVIDLHGVNDRIVPANESLSSDGYYYTPVEEIFNGNAYSPGWKTANGCSGPSYHYKTNYDDVRELWCVAEGNCVGGDVVRCSYKGPHNWFNGGGEDNGGVVTDFLLKWTKPSHIGKGYSKGDTSGPGRILDDVSTLEQKMSDPLPDWRENTMQANGKGHYGNPQAGCLSDEDVVPVATGYTCAPRIQAKLDQFSLPSPQCELGGVSPFSNGCPIDANVHSNSKAWPICLAKGNSTGAYERGDFHCMLVCPCESGRSGHGECSAESHAHCPSGAKCERGELRKRDQGVCTYPTGLFDVEQTSDLVV